MEKKSSQLKNFTLTPWAAWATNINCGWQDVNKNDEMLSSLSFVCFVCVILFVSVILSVSGLVLFVFQWREMCNFKTWPQPLLAVAGLQGDLCKDEHLTLPSCIYCISRFQFVISWHEITQIWNSISLTLAILLINLLFLWYFRSTSGAALLYFLWYFWASCYLALCA